MTIYFTPSASSPAETTSEGYQSGFSRCAVDCGASDINYVATPTLALPDEIYVHTYFKRRGSYGATYTLLSFLAGATEVFRVRTTATTIQMQALISAVMTNVGGTASIDEDIAEHLDIYFQGNDATGNVSLFLGGTELISATVDLSLVTGITAVRSYHPHRFSQLIIADEPTIGWRLITRYPNAAGATGDFTGTYTDVDETVYNDADFINSSTNGHVETYGQTGPAISGYTVRAVGVYARAKRGASGPANLQMALRSGGTDYFSASKALGIGYAAYGHIWETNPATAAAWVSTAIDALQPGVKAVT